MLGCHVARDSHVLDDAKTMPIDKAIARDCDAYGFNYAQIFTHGPQNYKAADIDRPALAEIRDIGLVVHGAYTLTGLWKITRDNVNSGKSQAMIGFMKKHLLAAQEIGAIGVIVHVGRVDSRNVAYVMHILQPIAQQTRSKIILEMIATKATEHTYETPFKIDNLTTLIGRRENWWGWCIDTAHIWAAGQDIRQKNTMAEWLAGIKYKERLVLFHLNGSSQERGSGHDTHQVPGGPHDLIWKGLSIKDSGIAAVVKFAVAHEIPMIMEINRGTEREISEAVMQINELID